MKQPLLAGLAMATVGLAMTGSATAATTSGYDYGPAAGNCQGALPAFAGTLRARPLAIGNEGTSNAFVSCGPDGSEPTLGKTISQFFVRIGNDAANASSITISCTFVHGYGSGPAPIYVTKSVTVAPGGFAGIALVPSDLGADITTLRYPQVSCGLPAGGLISYTGVLYAYEIGA